MFKFLFLAAVAAQDLEIETSQVVYGKYYSLNDGQRDTTDNSYFLFKPKGYDVLENGKLPMIIEIHGGGFTGGSPHKTATRAIQDAVNNGIAYVSVGYRLVATKYYYGNSEVEELIHVDNEGRLSLDNNGKTMDAYKVRRGRTEFNTKCSFDTVQMIEHIIAHADEYGLDVHRISTTGSSAGGGEIHYLTWVYHQWNTARYTPRGMVYTNAQLDYPVQNMLDRTWTLWTDDVGATAKLSTILDKKDCGLIVGNPWCDSGTSDYDLCNRTYHEEVTGRFCGNYFDSATLGEVRDTLVWPSEDSEVGKGMEVLWYSSLNMQKHQPKPFYLYVANSKNTTAGMNVVHNALYSRNYAKYAEMAGINYTVYYTDYHGMTDDDAGERRFENYQSVVYNYRSSHKWVEDPSVQEAGRTSPQEQLLYHCLALGVDCSASPSPSPSPGPSPGPTPASDDCKRAIDATCPKGVDCTDCIHNHARDFISAGCPPAREGGAQTCIDYCNSRADDVMV